MEKNQVGPQDQWVLEVQEWLNETYGSVSGFGKVIENGRTGWDTVYGLIRAVQHELGLTTLVNNFGPSTETAWNAQVPHILVEGNKDNIVKLIEGAFRCKGLGLGTFKDEYDTVYTEYGIKQLKALAGFQDPVNGNNTLFPSMWAKALFDMSAFVTVPGGSAKIRDVQQYLNRKYYLYTGIRGCDGIYQRATNEAIIYGLQAEMGMGTGTANGFFGAGTTANCPTLSSTQGSQENIYLLQAALIVNDMYSGSFNGQWNASLSTAIRNFRNFMKIGNIGSDVADMPVIKALLTTTGDINRPTDTIDTSLQINTQALANTLYSAGYRTIGRYLTGTVGNDFRPKYLTTNEIQILTQKGFSIFPIYQDGGWTHNYFASPGQGWKDGRLAGAAAYSLGFKTGTTIYFACDYDVLGHEIDTIISYMRDVQQAISMYFPQYNVSLYAPRNVCTRVMSAILEINTCFVSDMSSGFSANLGYKMPNNWAFDQYHETLLGGIPIDKVAKSGIDPGQVSFDEPKHLDEDFVSEDVREAVLAAKAQEFSDGLELFENVFGANFKTKEEYVAKAGPLRLIFKMEQGIKVNPDAPSVYQINNGNVETKFINDLELIQTILDITDSDNLVETLIDELGTIVDNGFYEVSFKAEMLSIGIEIKTTGNYEITNIHGVPIQDYYTVTLGLYFDPDMFPEGVNTQIDMIKQNQEEFEARLRTLGYIGVGGLALGGAFVVLGGVGVVNGIITGGTLFFDRIVELFSNLPSVVIP